MPAPQKTDALRRFRTFLVFVIAMLEEMPETVALAGSLEKLYERVCLMLQQFDLLEDRKIRAHVKVIGSDRRLDNLIRRVNNQTKDLDRESITLQSNSLLFSDGISELIAPTGRNIQTEIDNVRALYTILDKLAQKRSEFEVYKQTLEEGCLYAEACLCSLLSIDEQIDTLGVEEDFLKIECLENTSQIEGQLLQLFPSQKAFVRSFFNPPSTTPSKKKSTSNGSQNEPADQPTKVTPAASSPAPKDPTSPA